MISKPGIYVIKHTVTEEEYIISVVGTAPMLRVINVIPLKDFARGIDLSNKTLAATCESIERECNQFEYNQLESKYIGNSPTTEDLEDKQTELENIMSKFSEEQKIELQSYVAQSDKERAILLINKIVDLDYSKAQSVYTQLRLAYVR